VISKHFGVNGGGGMVGDDVAITIDLGLVSPVPGKVVGSQEQQKMPPKTTDPEASFSESGLAFRNRGK